MKLNIDCIRQVLLAIENAGYDEYLTLDKLCETISDFSRDDIEYSCLKLDEAGYINATFVNPMRKLHPELKSVNDLTFAGHEFLNSIHEPTNWEKTKTAAKKIGSFSLSTISAIANGLITASIPSVLQSILK